MKVIDWQCHFTEHQSHTWLACQCFFDEEIIHVLAASSSSAREKQGWKAVDITEMTTIQLKKYGWWKQGLGLLKEYPDAIHVFGGFWADKRFLAFILYAVWRGQKVTVMNESYATEAVGYLENSKRWINSLKVAVRPLLYRTAATIINIISKPHKFCILALSLRASDQFECAGFLGDQIFPFGYFVPKIEFSTKMPHIDTAVVRLIFVGSLLKRKGLDLAVSAVEELHASGVRVFLDVYGHGTPDEYISADSQCVTYKGIILFGQAQKVIAEYDGLILPSLHDGWGVVVNEALLQGVPVIVSSNVGAKCLIESSGAGMVFESGNQLSLRNALSEFISNSPLRKEHQIKAKNIGFSITPEKAAVYMKNVFDFYYSGQGDRPKKLWFGAI